ncbi:MAG: serine/threonine-protein kinase [Pseudomonadota bacterium]
MSEEKTAPPSAPPGAGQGDEDDEKTVFAPRAPLATDQEEDEDRTILAPSQPATPDEDRTIIGGLESAGEDADADRTIIAVGGAGDGQAAEDEDRTIISDLGAGPGPLPEEDEDRTVIVGLGSAAADVDATVITGTGAGGASGAEETTELGGSTYAPPTAAPTVAPTAVPTAGPTTGLTGTPTYTPPPPGTPPAPLSSLGPGTLIGGQYRVDKQLDEGGMGRVYRGWDLNTEADVAIKVILPEMAEDKKVADMFRREAKTLRQLHHDAIVRFFNYIPPNAELNMHALVMGYIEGTKLSDKLKQEGPLSEDDAIKLTRRLAEGLDKAHELEIVHRDLSPDNVMLPGDDIQKAVLIDFGISRSEKIKDVTLGNEFAGKLKYVSPEQLGAYGNDARGQSDVYSLALLMIAMLNGKPLPMGDTIVEAVQMRQGVPDLSGVPVRFQELLYKMLIPDPAQRLGTMAEVAEELRIMVEGDITSAPVKDNVVDGLQAVPMAATATTSGVTADIPAREVPEQKSRGLGLIMVLVLAAAAGGGGYLYSTGAFDPPEPVAAATPEDGLVRVAGSRATFLAETLPDGCAFAVRRTQGPQAGLLEGYAADRALLDGVADRFGTAFGTAPGVVTREIPDAHCPALDMVRALQGTQGAGMEMSLDANEVARGTGVIGRLHGSDGRQNWLGLIDPQGRVFSLMRQLDDPIGDERRFSFRLPSAQSGTFMLIATASDAPLVRAGALQDGTPIADFLPLLLRELATAGQGAADVAYLNLTQ